MRKFYLLFIAALFSLLGSSQNVIVNPGAGSYPNLQAAFNAINGGIHTGAIFVNIAGNTSEPGSATLNASGNGAASYTSITITPTGSRTINGSVVGGPLIDFNGADNVTIDGLKTGANELYIINTAATVTAETSTIRFIDGATSNTITNCVVLGSGFGNVATNGAVIYFSTDNATTNGNDNNTISNCNIGPAGANLPAKAIQGVGSTSTAARGNSGINIDNNNIYDIFLETGYSSGIATNDGCNTWTITNNRFYQTTPKAWASGGLHTAIDIRSANLNGAQGFTITGNIIGYASNTQTGIYTLTNAGSPAKFRGIYYNGVTTGATTTISNNTIASVSMTGVAEGTGANSPFAGILVQGGNVVSNNNTIGSQTNSSSLFFNTNTGSAFEVYGMLNISTRAWTSNTNNIGGITVGNTSSGSPWLVGMAGRSTGTTTWTATSNTIGGTSANSLSLFSSATNAQVTGMLNTFPTALLTSNIIRNLSTNLGNGTGLSASVTGINITSATPSNHTLSQNTIYNLANSNTTAASTVTGIQFSGSTNLLVERNRIYALTVSTNNDAAEVNGIRIAGGTTTYRNNMIAIGAGINNAVSINGINETAGTNNFFNNSIYIGGSPATGAGNSYAFSSVVVTNTRAVQGNILSNARNNNAATGKNYAVKVGGTTANPAGLTINNNQYFHNGIGGVFGFFNGADVTDLATWKTTVGQDAGSFFGDPVYIAPTNAVPDLHISPASPCESASVTLAGVTNDFDGDTRPASLPDIGADEIAGAGKFQFSSATYSGAENTTVTITVNRLGGTTGAISVDYGSNNGSATGGVTCGVGIDYQSVLGTLRWNDGEAGAKTFTVTLCPDFINEGDETLNLTLVNPIGGTSISGTNPAILTITDVPVGIVQFSSATYSGTEGGIATITATRTGGSLGAITVDYGTSNGTATGGTSCGAGIDYQSASGTLSWADGETTSKTFTVSLCTDFVNEPGETVNLTLSNATGGATIGALNTAILTINDVPVGTVQFSTASYSGTEGGTATITATRTGGSLGAITVDYATSNGTATGGAGCAAGVDYQSASGTLSWANGETASKTFTISLCADILNDPGETVLLTLSNPTGGAVIGTTNPATLTIANLPVGNVQFSAATYSGNENATVTITATRTGGSYGAISVNYATSDGTATGGVSCGAGIDYQSTTGTLSWADGETASKTFIINLCGDPLDDGGESVNLILSNPTGGASLGANNTAVLTIANVGPGIVGFAALSYEYMEGSTASLNVYRNGGNYGAVSVDYVIHNGTATGGASCGTGVDYILGSGTISFADGEVGPKPITVNICSDLVIDPNETILVDLSNPTGGATLNALINAHVDVVDAASQFCSPSYIFIQNLVGSAPFPASPYPSNITVSGLTGVIQTMRVTLGNFAHNLPDDVDILLVGPGGQKLILMSDAGGSSVATARIYTFSDAAPQQLADESVSPAGYYRPTNYETANDTWATGIPAGPYENPGPGGTPTGSATFASVFGGIDPNGTWSLYVSDDGNGNDGVISTWCLEFITVNTSGTVQFSTANFSGVEGSPATITVNRVGGNTGAIAVNYATSNNTATGAISCGPGLDFIHSNGTLTWADGDMSPKTFTVNLCYDNLTDPGEIVNLTLSNPVGTTISGTNPARLFIDNNPPGTVQFSSATYTGAEGTNATITVNRTGGSTGFVTVNYITSAGTAVGGATCDGSTDYRSTAGFLSWVEGETGPKTFNVTLCPDALFESTESLNLTLSNPSGGVVIGTQNTATLNITNAIPNDNAVGAIHLSLGACGSPVYSNTGATQSPGEPWGSCSSFEGYSTVWYSFTAPPSGAVRVSTNSNAGTLHDTRVALFAASNPADYSTFSIISCDEDGGTVSGAGEYTSVLFATGLTGGTEYYVQVDGFTSAEQGTFCLSIEEINTGMLSTNTNCVNNSQRPFGGSGYTGWFSLLDKNANLIALVRDPSGGDLFDYSDQRQNVHTGPVRVTNGKYYLDRNFLINNAAASNVDVQFFYLNSELTALNAVDGTTAANIGVVRQVGTSCQPDFSAAAGVTQFLPQTGNGASSGGTVRWVQVRTPGFSNFYLQSAVNGVLPTTLLSFSGQKEGAINKLRWTTATEQNNKGFEIQFSSDGVNYSSIGFVNSLAAGGNSNDQLAYSFVDNNTGGKQYYRLRQVNLDGRSQLSTIVLIKGNKPAILSLSGVFPNPASSSINVLVDAPVKNKLTLIIMDATGKTVLQQAANVEAGSNTISINIDRLTGGSYLVKMICNGDVVTGVGRFVKQ